MAYYWKISIYCKFGMLMTSKLEFDPLFLDKQGTKMPYYAVFELFEHFEKIFFSLTRVPYWFS